MTTINTTLTHEGVEYLAEIAVIERVDLGPEDHGIFTLNIAFAGASGSWGQGFGDRALDSYDETTRKRHGSAYGMDYLIEVTKVAGRLTEARGNRLFVLRTEPYGAIEGIATLDGDRVFIAQAHADKWFAKGEGA